MIKITSFDAEGNDVKTVEFDGTLRKARSDLKNSIVLMQSLGIDPYDTVAGFHISEQMEFNLDS